MAEEANVTSPHSATSGTDMEKSQHDNGAKATNVATQEGISEPSKEGAEQEEAADSRFTFKDFILPRN